MSKMRCNKMNQNIIAIVLVFVFSWSSCTNSPGDQDQMPGAEATPKIKASLSGQVYMLSDSVHSDCKVILPGTDYWPTFLFLNDSVFIKTINHCCMPSTISHYSGKYQMTNELLSLTYDSLQVIYTFPIEKADAGIPADLPATVEVERSDLQIEKLERFNCTDKPYFKQTQGPWEGRFIAFTSDTIEKYIEEIKDFQVWNRLMPFK